MELYFLKATDRQFEDLGNSVIARAAKDYKRAVRLLKKDPEDLESIIIKEEIEEFFLSDWFNVLTNLDGNNLLRRLKKSLQ